MVSPAWRRYEVTRLVLAERRWLCDRLAERGWHATSVVVADDENLEIAREYGFDTVEMGNDDLGAKFNAGYRHAAKEGADVFVHVGSDDWVHPDVFGILADVDLEKPPSPVPSPGRPVVYRRAPQAVGQRRIAVVHLADGVLRQCRVLGNYGCIPWLIPRGALAPSKFAPIQPGLGRGIDGALVRGMASRPNWVFQDAQPEWCVDFKTDLNLTPYRWLADSIGDGPDLDAWETLAGWYPADLVAMARDTHELLLGGTR